jgi:hypothetical protein
MTRVRICAEHPGTIIRHHDFESFPAGTSPHTTALFDYLILGLAFALRPLTAQPIDLAGAFVSPLLALACGWFLWWWSGRLKLRYRRATLLLFALSPILVHATKLGRPDHQSLILTLVTIALCGEWSLHVAPSRYWSLTSGIAWGLALWVSWYEPLVLLVVVLVLYAVSDRQQFTSPARRSGWIALVTVVALALAIEQRIPDFGFLRADSSLTNWMRTIGELSSVPITDPIWFHWCGLMMMAVPVLFVVAWWKRKSGTPGGRVLPMLALLLIASFVLTLWQSRWAYFFATIFALVLPVLVKVLPSRVLAWALVLVSFFPILQYWDAQLWPNEAELTRRLQARRATLEWRALAEQMRDADIAAGKLIGQSDKRRNVFLAPWWLSPSVAYWSGQPGVAGSSHESFPGILESARFCLTSDEVVAREILQRHEVRWLLVCDAERMLDNSRAILGTSIPANSLAQVLDRTPARAPGYLMLWAQNSSGKLYRVNYFP